MQWFKYEIYRKSKPKVCVLQTHLSPRGYLEPVTFLSDSVIINANQSSKMPFAHLCFRVWYLFIVVIETLTLTPKVIIDLLTLSLCRICQDVLDNVFTRMGWTYEIYIKLYNTKGNIDERQCWIIFWSQLKSGLTDCNNYTVGTKDLRLLFFFPKSNLKFWKETIS